jgi:uncharacterized protein (TIGR02118 family)
MDYYVNTHIPLAMRLLKNGLRRTEVDAGVAAAGVSPPFFGGCHFYFDSIEAFLVASGPVAKELQDDVQRYTNVSPITQFNRNRSEALNVGDPAIRYRSSKR